MGHIIQNTIISKVRLYYWIFIPRHLIIQGYNLLIYANDKWQHGQQRNLYNGYKSELFAVEIFLNFMFFKCLFC